MFYFYFRIFNWFSCLFGLSKPFNYLEKKTYILLWSKMWSILIIVLALISHLYIIDFKIEFDIKGNLEQLSNINNLFINIIIILYNIYNEDVYRKLYLTLTKIFALLKLEDESVKLISEKFYVLTSLYGVLFIILIILELIFDKPPYIFLIRIPLFFAFFHLLVHLSIILSFLKIINGNLLEILKSDTSANTSVFLEYGKLQKRKLFYYLDPEMYFNGVKPYSRKTNLKFYFEIYDELSTTLLLLENCHGIEVLLLLWSMFTSSVTTVTLITDQDAMRPWLEVLRGVQGFLWFGTGCYVDNKIRQEVDLIEAFIIKNLIDFRCDQTTKDVLHTFMLVVKANNLQFTACNLYRLNYATILGTVVSIITYSIISIQLF